MTPPPRFGALIDELVREGARGVLAEALRAEVDSYIAQFINERDEHGRRLVVRNGSRQPREVLTSAGAVEVTVPRVNDKRIDPDTGERARFASAILPPWCRKTPKITEVVPLLYLHGLSTGDFVPALGQFLGSTAGLSAPVITKLTETWKAEQQAFSCRDLSGVDYVYLWVDGIHVNIRLENVLGALPKSAHPGAKKALGEIWNAEDKNHARAAMTAFEAAYGAKFPKAVAKITDDVEELHWIHLRTTNRSSPRSPPSGTGRRSLVGRDRGRRGWRWRSSSSRPPRLVGGR